MMQDYEKELAAIRELLEKNPEGMSVTDIAKGLGKNKNTTGRYLDVLLISGQVEMRMYGMAKVYTLARRLPFASISSCTADPVIAFDGDLRVVEINESFLSILGLSRADAIGKNIAHLRVQSPDAIDLLSAVTSQAGRPDSTVSFGQGDGNERVFKQNSIPTVFPDGTKGTTVVLHDITALLVAGRRVRERELRFRLMAENIRDGLVIIEDDKVVFANRRILEISGYSLEELGHMGPAAVVIPEDRERMEEIAGGYGSKQAVPTEYQTRIVRKDGQTRDIYGRISAFQHEGHRFTFHIMTDVTEIMNKGRALAESEERFRLMAENIRDGLVIIEDGKIVFCNRRVIEMTGYEAGELSSMESLDLISPEERKELALYFTQAAEEPGYAREFFMWIVRKDSTRRYLSARLSSARHRDTIGLYLIITDITEFAQREQALRDRIASLQELIS